VTAPVRVVVEDPPVQAVEALPLRPVGPPRTIPAGGRRLVLDPDPPALHRPAADELFSSVAATVGGQRLGAAAEVVGLGQIPAAIRSAVARLVRA
jgi:hypothetical protein